MKKIALITGASRGIGRECALLLAKNQYHVIAHYNKSQQDLISLIEEVNNIGGKITTFQANLEIESEILSLASFVKKNFGQLDVLVNNAGVSLEKLLIDTENIEIEKLFNINLKAPIILSRELCKLMMENHFGRIINISSIWGELGGSMETVYSATKAGLIGFTKSFAKEMALMNITVNCISPGAVNTNMMKTISKENQETFKNEIPINRFAEPEEIARVVLFLASEKSSYITAENIKISGGL